jgi:hypothetical protein
MTYACPAWVFADEFHLLKLQRLQNKVLRTIGNFPRRLSVRDMHVAFHVPYVYENNKIKQKQFIIMKMKMYAILDKAKPHTEYIKVLNLEAFMSMTVQMSRLL